jgi:hypothetical protein
VLAPPADPHRGLPAANPLTLRPDPWRRMRVVPTPFDTCFSSCHCPEGACRVTRPGHDSCAVELTVPR